MSQRFLYSINSTLKFTVGFVGTFVFRLITPAFGLSNVSPLMATEFAGGKAYGPWVAGAYGALSILLIDLVMAKVGLWTLVTALTYGAIGVWGAFYFRKRSASARHFVFAGVVGALFFDLITGVLMGPLFYGQPWGQAIMGQIPFTLRHVAGNIVFGALLAPWFYRAIMNNPRFEVTRLLKFV